MASEMKIGADMKCPQCGGECNGLLMRRQRYAHTADTKRIFRTVMPYGLQGSPRTKKLN